MYKRQIEILREFKDGKKAVVAVKHTNPCGVGLGDTLKEAWDKACLLYTS